MSTTTTDAPARPEATYPTPVRPDDDRFVPLARDIGEVAARHAADHDRDATFVAEAYDAMREHGYLALAVPEDLGGLGASMRQVCYAQAELARHDGATGLAQAMHQYLTLLQVFRRRAGAPDAEGVLRRIAGEGIVIATSGGSDWLWPTTIATPVTENGEAPSAYRITGRKAFCSQSPGATVVATSAVVGEPGPGAEVIHFSVPFAAEGVSLVETWDTLGMRGSGSHDVVFDGVFVPDAAIAARRKPDVWHPLLHLVSMIAFPIVYSVYTGIAEAARDIAVAEAAKRRDPGVETVGALDTELAAARIACDSLVAFAESASPGPETTNTVFVHRSLIARSVLRAVDLAMDAAGGSSYFRRVGLERLFRDVQGARFHPLTDGAQRRLAGRTALGLPIDG